LDTVAALSEAIQLSGSQFMGKTIVVQASQAEKNKMVTTCVLNFSLNFPNYGIYSTFSTNFPFFPFFFGFFLPSVFLPSALLLASSQNIYYLLVKIEGLAFSPRPALIAHHTTHQKKKKPTHPCYPLLPPTGRALDYDYRSLFEFFFIFIFFRAVPMGFYFFLFLRSLDPKFRKILVHLHSKNTEISRKITQKKKQKNFLFLSFPH